jgi:hypothetical protein
MKLTAKKLIRSSEYGFFPSRRHFLEQPSRHYISSQPSFLNEITQKLLEIKLIEYVETTFRNGMLGELSR